ncbi:MAG TPA: hypothetical protein VE287_01505, partial [Actinopolymorphaceae bacterium]|nr:hypothetical protein [Actinopolymorphaceae bacterium]
MLGAGVLAIAAAVLPATPAAASGGLDPSFGTNGTAAIKITEWRISPGILLPGWNGGTILVGGTSKSLGGYSDDFETLEAGALASVTSTGAPDTTFNYGEVRAIDPEAGFVMEPG